MCEDVTETLDVPITIINKSFTRLISKIESRLEDHDNIGEKLDSGDLELRLCNGEDSECEIETMEEFSDYYNEQQDEGNDTIVIKVKFVQLSPDPQSDSNEKNKNKNKNKKNDNNNNNNNNDNLSDFMPSDQDEDSDVQNDFTPTDDEKSNTIDITEKAPINVSCSIRSKDGDIYGHVTWELVKGLNEIINDNEFNWVYCILVEYITRGKQQQVQVNDKNCMQWVGKLQQNEEYVVSVKIMNALTGASSPWSNQVKFKAQLKRANDINDSQTEENKQAGQGIARLEAPKYIHIQSIGKNMVRLGWEPVSRWFIKYYVYETKQHASSDAAISCHTPFCVINELVPNKEYSFKIQAEDESRNEKSFLSEPFPMYFPDISSFVFHFLLLFCASCCFYWFLLFFTVFLFCVSAV